MPDETPEGRAGTPFEGLRTAAVSSGVPAPREHPKRPPVWRKVLFFLMKWTLYAAAGFIVASLALVFAYRFIAPPPTWNMVGAGMDGVRVQQRWVDLEKMSPHLVRAVIAAEDARFCSHDGFDLEEIRRAIAEQDDRGYLRGASTISQQTAKNAFLFNGGSFVRKAVEAWFTVLIEAAWPKRRILEVYLNIAEWGDGLYGAEAAARTRFDTSAAELSRQQAALLASVLPSPNKWRVDPPGRYVTRRAGQVRARMDVVRRDGLADCVLAPAGGG